MDTAPPLTLTLSWSNSSSRIVTMLTTAKASLISNKSMSLTFNFALSKVFLIAPMGAVVNHLGSWATPS